MWRRIVVGCGLALATLASVVGIPVALAQQAPSQGNTGNVRIDGFAQVVETQQGEQLSLAGDAMTGDTPWHLEAVLTPTSVDSRNVLRFTGQFTLSGGDSPVIGQATGTLTQGGQATISLSDSTSGTQLQSSFLFQTGGAFSMALTGQYPAISPAASADTGTHTFWYLSRTAGITAYGLLFLNVCLGLMVQTGWVDRVFPRWRSFDLHQFTALLALGVLSVHVFALLGDHYFNFSIPQLLVPFSAPYRSLWTGFGVIALYLTILVTASFYVRRRIGQRMWRALHYLTFGIFVLALMHGLFAGTDSVTAWARLTYFSTGTAVAVLTWRRIQDRKRGGPSVIIATEFRKRPKASKATNAPGGRPRLGPSRTPVGQPHHR